MLVVMDDLLQELTDFEEKPQEWVWDGFIPSGTVTLLTGNAGMGKSVIAMNVAAMVTRGMRSLPKSAPLFAPLGEEQAGAAAAAEQRVEGGGYKPPLRGATGGTGDVDKPLFHLTRELSRLEASLQRLREAGREVGLIVIDPIDKYLSPSDNARQRIAVVDQLAELASKWNVAILVTTNSTARSKTRGQEVLYQELMNTARSVLTIVPNLEETDQRLVLPVKMNVAEMPPGVSFSVVNGVVRWDEDRIFLSIEDHAIQTKIKLKNPLIGDEVEKVPQLRRVALWLKEQLLPGRVGSRWIRGLAGCQKVAYSMLRRAYKGLGCRSKKEENGQWFWYLPGHAARASDEIVEEPYATPESISGITREFTPDNFTSWSKGRDPADAIFAGAKDNADEPPLVSTMNGAMMLTPLIPTV